jgi:hypothetical protein
MLLFINIQVFQYKGGFYMRELQILINKDFNLAINVDDMIIFSSPVDCVDVIHVIDLLCRQYNISAGESTLSLYKFLEDKISEIKAGKEEYLMNQKFYSRVA